MSEISRFADLFGGPVTLGVGFDLLVFLRFCNPAESAYRVGLIPAFVGPALPVYAFQAKRV